MAEPEMHSVFDLHPDLFLLNEIVAKIDVDFDGLTTEEERDTYFSETLGKVADPDSLMAMATKRACKMLGISTQEELVRRADEIAKLAVLWLEGFLVGVQWRR